MVRTFQKYPGFADRVHEGLQDIFGDKGKNVITYHAEDGSGVGSAIIAGKPSPSSVQTPQDADHV